MRVNSYLLIWILSLLTLPRAHAKVEYSNLGPNDAFGGGAIAVDGPSSGFGGVTVADQFTASFTGLMNTVEVAIVNSSGPPALNVSIELNDPSTNLPLVSSRVLLGTVTPSDPPLVTLTLATPYLLSVGTAYWLELAPSAPATADGWYVAYDQHANPAATSFDSGGTFRTFAIASAFRVNATSVPEPSTLGLECFCGLFALIIAICHKRRQASKQCQSNQSTMERTADRSGTAFQMTSTLPLRVTHGVVRRRSSCSR